jgi:hypothetical protein
MNLYAVIGSGMGTPEAASLGVRLTAWHDAMVAHERLLRSTRATDGCDDECPHAEARGLWAEALEMFGPRAHELTFLSSRGKKAHRGSRRGTSTGRPAEHGMSPDRGVPL